MKNTEVKKVFVQTGEACQMLGISRYTLTKISTEAGALLRLGRQNNLHDIEKIIAYMRKNMGVNPGIDQEADQDTTGEIVDPGLDHKGDQEEDPEEDPEADQDSTESVPKAIS